MEQKNKTGFLQGQNGEEEENQVYIWFCIRDMLEKLKSKADELESSKCTVLQTTKLLMREALDLLCFLILMMRACAFYMHTLTSGIKNVLLTGAHQSI